MSKEPIGVNYQSFLDVSPVLFESNSQHLTRGHKVLSDTGTPCHPCSSNPYWFTTLTQYLTLLATTPFFLWSHTSSVFHHSLSILWRRPYPWMTFTPPSTCNLRWSPGIWGWEDFRQLGLLRKTGVPGVLEGLWSSWWPLDSYKRGCRSQETYFRVSQAKPRSSKVYFVLYKV